MSNSMHRITRALFYLWVPVCVYLAGPAMASSKNAEPTPVPVATPCTADAADAQAAANDGSTETTKGYVEDKDGRITSSSATVAAKGLSRAEQAARLLTTAKSFRAIAQTDFVSAMDVLWTDTLRNRWQQEGGSVFNERIASAAFFSHVFTFLGPISSNTGFVGFYNPWVDSILVVRFDNKDGRWLATDFRLFKGAGQGPEREVLAVAARADQAAVVLQTRVTGAQTKFRLAFGPDGDLIASNVPAEIGDIKGRIQSYVEGSRKWFARDGKGAGTPGYSTFLSDVMGLLRLASDSQKPGKLKRADIANLGAVMMAPVEWLRELSPVFAAGDGKDGLVALASFNAPDRIVIIQLIATKDGVSVKDNVAIVTLATEPTAPAIPANASGNGRAK